MKRKARLFAEHGGQARTIAIVMYRAWRTVMFALAALASFVYMPVQEFAYGRANTPAFVSMSAAAAPLTGHLDVALSNFAKGYTQNGLISDILCPRVPVGRQTDKYFIHGREGQQLTEKTLRAAGAPAQRTRLTLSTDSFSCNSHALASEIPAESAAAYNMVGDLAQDAVKDQMDKILLDKELACRDLLTSTANLTSNTTLSGTSQWSDGANSDPLTDVETAKQSVMLVGQAPNVMVITPAIFKALKGHPQVRDAFKYTTPGAIGLVQLAAFFQIERVLLAMAVDYTTGTAAFAWGKDAIVAYLATSPGSRDISLAKTFVWGGAPGTVGGMGTVRAPHPDPTAKSEIVGTDFYYHQKVTAADAGYLIKAAVA